MNKKAIAILGVLFVLILGTLGYLVYSRQNNTAAPSANVDQNGNNPDSNGDADNGDNGSNSPSAPVVGSFVKLTDQQVVSPALFFEGGGITYLDRNGEVYLEDFEYDSNGKMSLARKRSLDYPPKSEVQKVLWPLAGSDYIVQTSSSSRQSWSFFDVSQKAYVDYPSQITSVDWMPDGKKIVYVWLENGKASLNISDPDLANWTQVADMWETDDSIHISPDGLNILYYRNQKNEASNAINLTTPDGKVWKALVKEGYNYGVLWSPDSKKFLFAKKEDSTAKFDLWYYDLQTSESKNLGVSTTVDKAVWSTDGKFIYVAVPTTGSAGVDELTNDKIYKIDTENPSGPQVYDPSSLTLDGRDLLLSKDGSKLLVRNMQDGGLYYVVLQ